MEVMNIKKSDSPKQTKMDQENSGQSVHVTWDEKEALEMAKIIIDNSPVVLFRRIAGDDPKLTYVSANIQNYGYSAKELLSGEVMFRSMVHPDDVDRLGDEIESYEQKNIENFNCTYRILTRQGEVRWLEDRTSVIRDESGTACFNQGVLVDITDRKKTETALAESEEKYRRIVSTSAQGFILMDGEMKIMDVNDTFCNLLGYTRSQILDKTPQDLASPEFATFISAHKKKLLELEVKETEGQFLTKNGRMVPVLLHSSPLTNDDNKFIGIMAFITDMTEQKKAMALAGEVQKSLLTTTQPKINGFDIAGKSKSCDEIGGDYFDFIMQGQTQGSINVVIGDIAGHGVDAALFMTTARGFLRMRAAQPGNAAQIITDMNRHLSEDVLESGRFMTLFFISLDPGSGNLRWVRAGHDPAMVYDPDTDTFENLMGTGTALGVDQAYSYTEQSYTNLAKGKIIILGTDGIWEANNRKGIMFGKERLKKLIQKNADMDAKSMVDSVFKGIDVFTSGEKPMDDLTLVIIKRV
jgi:sigma-B regulation protein RsbU (phosphoserine phosphatase)